MIIFLITFLTLSNNKTYANTSCGQTAIINYQEVLIDTNTNKKAEGLRYYLSKDKEAEELLNEYQDLNKPNVWTTLSSTTGTVLLLSSVLLSGSSTQTKSSLAWTGVGIIGLSYLINKTRQFGSEKILEKAVNKYNKSNSPHIYFMPYNNNGNTSLGVGTTMEF